MSEYNKGDRVRVEYEAELVDSAADEYGRRQARPLCGDPAARLTVPKGAKITLLKREVKVGDLARNSDLEHLPVGTVLQNMADAPASENLVKQGDGQWLWLRNGKTYPSSHFISGGMRKVLYLP